MKEEKGNLEERMENQQPPRVFPLPVAIYVGGFAFIFGLIIAGDVITYIGMLELLSDFFDKSPSLFAPVATLCVALGALPISLVAFFIGWKIGLRLDRVKVWTVGRGVLGGVAAGCYPALLALPFSGSQTIDKWLIIILAQGALGGLYAALWKRKMRIVGQAPRA